MRPRSCPQHTSAAAQVAAPLRYVTGEWVDGEPAGGRARYQFIDCLTSGEYVDMRDLTQAPPARRPPLVRPNLSW